MVLAAGCQVHGAAAKLQAAGCQLLGSRTKVFSHMVEKIFLTDLHVSCNSKTSLPL